MASKAMAMKKMGLVKKTGILKKAGDDEAKVDKAVKVAMKVGKEVGAKKVALKLGKEVGAKKVGDAKKRPAAAEVEEVDLTFLENDKHRRAAYGRMEYALKRSAGCQGWVVHGNASPRKSMHTPAEPNNYTTASVIMPPMPSIWCEDSNVCIDHLGVARLHTSITRHRRF